MEDTDIDYFAARAEQELDWAQRASDPQACRAHYIIANHYLDRVFGGAPDSERAAA